jgi:hypothetical protein
MVSAHLQKYQEDDSSAGHILENVPEADNALSSLTQENHHV